MKLGTFVRPVMDKLDEAFIPLEEMGFTSCQLAYKPETFRKEDAEAIRAAADRHGIEISAHFIGYRDAFTIYDLRYGYTVNGLSAPTHRADRMNYLMKGVEFIPWLGITDMIIHAGFLPNNPFDPEYAALLTCIRQLGAKAKSLGVNLLFETGAESPVTLLRLIEESELDNLYVNLDTGNAIMYGYANPVDALYTLGHLVRNIHIKDGLPPTNCYMLGSETALGDGVVDFDRFIAKLLSLGYDRFLTIEREISGPQQKLDILKAKQYIEKKLVEYQK